MHEQSYLAIGGNLAKNAQGVPLDADGNYSAAFLKYLTLLYTPEEADLVQYLKVPGEILPTRFNADRYMTAGQVSVVSGRDPSDVKRILDSLVERNRLGGLTRVIYGTPKKIWRLIRNLAKGAGFFGMMVSLFKIAVINIREVVTYGPRKVGGFFFVSLYTLPYIRQFINVHQFYPEVHDDDREAAVIQRKFFLDDGYYKKYQTSEKGTPSFRVIPVQRAIEHSQKILKTEEAHAIIDRNTSIALVTCPCRMRPEKLGIRECKDKNPVGACIMLGISADYYESIGIGKRVSAAQAKAYLDEMQSYGLIAATENWEKSPNGVMCLCCGCCCSMVGNKTRRIDPFSISPSNYVARANERCVCCGSCEIKCIFKAISVDRNAKQHTVNEKLCVGCGVCAITCKKEAVKLHRIERSYIPADSPSLYAKTASENDIEG